jgi:predicted nucleotidyltransferase
LARQELRVHPRLVGEAAGEVRNNLLGMRFLPSDAPLTGCDLQTNFDLRIECIILLLKEGIMCDKDTLNLITEKVCAAAKEVLGDRLEKVVLFGSYARGDYRDWSDIDIMILADIQPEKTGETRRKIHKIMNHLDLELDVLVSLLVVCRSIYREYYKISPLYLNIREEGIELYA